MGRKKRKKRRYPVAQWPDDKVWNRCILKVDAVRLAKRLEIEERKRIEQKNKLHQKPKRKEMARDEFDSLSYKLDDICPDCGKTFQSSSYSISISVVGSDGYGRESVYRCPYCSGHFR